MITPLLTTGWNEYSLIDSGDGYRLEKYGDILLSRPDPQCIWKKSDESKWEKVHAHFEKEWKIRQPVPGFWNVVYKDLTFHARLTPFKHTGIFPEQHLNWDFMREKIKLSGRKDVKILNLFGYTGGASIACVAQGASVTHVDASKKAIQWAKENQEASGLTDKPIRWILDDAVAFVKREIRRGVVYDGIVMDPPVYGHGPDGEIWDFQKSFPLLLEDCFKLLSKDPLFLIVNAYAITASSFMLENVLKEYVKNGTIEHGELIIEDSFKKNLSTGIYARWSSN